MRRRLPRAGIRRVLCVALLAASAAGCGFGLQDHPEAFDPKDVPFGLLKRFPKITTTTTTTTSTTTTTTLPPDEADG